MRYFLKKGTTLLDVAIRPYKQPLTDIFSIQTCWGAASISLCSYMMLRCCKYISMFIHTLHCSYVDIPVTWNIVAATHDCENVEWAKNVVYCTVYYCHTTVVHSLLKSDSNSHMVLMADPGTAGCVQEGGWCIWCRFWGQDHQVCAPVPFMLNEWEWVGWAGCCTHMWCCTLGCSMRLRRNCWRCSWTPSTLPCHRAQVRAEWCLTWTSFGYLRTQPHSSKAADIRNGHPLLKLQTLGLD